MSGCVVVKKETDRQHQPMPITAISHHPSGPVAISDHQSKITTASGVVLKTHGKKQPNEHQPSLYKTITWEDRYLSGSHCSCTSLSVCLCFSGHHFRMMKSDPPALLLCVPDHQTEQDGPRGGFLSFREGLLGTLAIRGYNLPLPVPAGCSVLWMNPIRVIFRIKKSERHGLPP